MDAPSDYHDTSRANVLRVCIRGAQLVAGQGKTQHSSNKREGSDETDHANDVFFAKGTTMAHTCCSTGPQGPCRPCPPSPPDWFGCAQS